MGWVVAQAVCPQSLWPAWGQRGQRSRTESRRATTHLAHKSSFLLLFVCFPFLSFDAHVVGFKVKTRQHWQKAVLPAKLPQTPLGTSDLLAGRRAAQAAWGPAHTRRSLADGRALGGFPLCPSSLAGSHARFCLRWDLYKTPRVLDREQGSTGHPPFTSPCTSLPHPPPAETTKVKMVPRDDAVKITDLVWVGGFQLEGDGLKAG